MSKNFKVQYVHRGYPPDKGPGKDPHNEPVPSRRRTRQQRQEISNRGEPLEEQKHSNRLGKRLV